MYGTRQAARQWHQRISGWMESHGYLAVNNEKTMFMKWEGSDFIMHGLFVDDMAHASTSQKMIKKFMKEYSKDFEYTAGDFMTSFLGLEVEQDKGQFRLHLNTYVNEIKQENGQIRLHLDTYVNEMLEEYKAYIKRDLKPRKMPMQPGVVLTKDDAPETPDPKEQKIYRSFVAKIQFVANWVRHDVSFAASQLARFCASAGVSHWAALHHVKQQSKFQTRISAWKV
jgi:hypothetical protein